MASQQDQRFDLFCDHLYKVFLFTFLALSPGAGLSSNAPPVNAAPKPQITAQLPSELTSLCRLALTAHETSLSGARPPAFLTREARALQASRAKAEPQLLNEALDQEMDPLTPENIRARWRRQEENNRISNFLINQAERSHALREDAGLDIPYHRLANLSSVLEIFSTLRTNQLSKAANLMKFWIPMRQSVHEIMDATQNLEATRKHIKNLESQLSPNSMGNWKPRLLKQIGLKPVQDLAISMFPKEEQPVLEQLVPLLNLERAQEEIVLRRLPTIAEHYTLFMDAAELVINSAQGRHALSDNNPSYTVARDVQNVEIALNGATEQNYAAELARASITLLGVLDSRHIDQYNPESAGKLLGVTNLRQRISERYLPENQSANSMSLQAAREEQLALLNSLQTEEQLRIVEAIYLRDTVRNFFRHNLMLRDLHERANQKVDKKYLSEVARWTPLVFNQIDPLIRGAGARFRMLKWARIDELWDQLTARTTTQRHLTRLIDVLLAKAPIKDRLLLLENAAAGDEQREIYQTFYRIPAFRPYWYRFLSEIIETSPNGEFVLLADGSLKIKKEFEPFKKLALMMIDAEKEVIAGQRSTPAKLNDINPFDPVAPAAVRTAAALRRLLVIAGVTVTLTNWVGIDTTLVLDLRDTLIRMGIDQKARPYLAEQSQKGNWKVPLIETVLKRIDEFEKESRRIRELQAKGDISSPEAIARRALGIRVDVPAK